LLSDGAGERGRWSYVARDPVRTLAATPEDPSDPFARLADLIGAAAALPEAGPPFQGGVAGLAAYELGDHVERLGLVRMTGWPDLACSRYETLLAFDHHQREVLAIGRDAATARAALGWLHGRPFVDRPGPLACALEAPPPAKHEAQVAEVAARIAAGE